MDLLDIRESGLLELYVLGQCSAEEIRIVEIAIKSFPELKKDLYQIGAALEQYARLHSVAPAAELKDQILEEVRKDNTTVSSTKQKKSAPTSTRMPGMIAMVLAASTLALAYFLYLANQEKAATQQELDEYKIFCDSIQLNSDAQYAQLERLQDPDNDVLVITPTEKYAETEIFLIYNSNDQQNFVQVRNLPIISDQQSFQLWSLKEGQNPIPLTVFQGDEGFFIPVEYESGTATYAITIEPFGGGQVPTLEDLIGTFNVPA